MPFAVNARSIAPNQDDSTYWMHLSVIRYAIYNHVRQENPGRYQLPLWLIYCNLDPGAAVLDEHDVRTPLKPGTIVVLPPWQEWRYHQNADQVRHIAISIDTPQLSRSQVRKHFLGAQVIQGGGAWRRELLEIRRIARMIESGTGQSASSSCMVQAVCFRIFQLLMEKMPHVQAPPDSIRRIVEVVEKDLTVDMRRRDLERIAGCGVRALNRTFLAFYGVSAATFVRERRIAKAADLLINSEWTIDRITSTVGFANRAYFSRAFSRKMGLAPARYRRERRPR